MQTSSLPALTDEAMSTILLVSDDAVDVELIRKALARPPGGAMHLERVRRLGDAVKRVRKGGIDAVLLDLFLPDSQGIGTFKTLYAAAALIPILLLTSREHEEVARKATLHGAEDHLLRDRLDSYWLPRILRSVIEHKAGEEALYEERERAQVTLNSIGDAVLSTDVAGNVVYLNVVAEEMTGWSRREAIGRPLAEVFQIIDGTTRRPALDPLAQAVRQNKAVGLAANCILIRRDGSESEIEDSAAPIHDRTGQVTGAVIVFHDVSVARAVTEKMAHLAQHDFLTNLPNRVLFGDRITSAISLARRHAKKCAVLFLDLDGFKRINDTFGHTAGDELLPLIARRLESCVRGSDTVSRQGGDEFLVLLAEINDAADAAVSAEKILSVLTPAYCVDGQEMHISATIGISVCPDHGADAETLIRCADTAMYKAKESGRNTFLLFEEDENVAPVRI